MSTNHKNLQAWWLNHICGQPVPVLETLLVKCYSNFQSKPTLGQLEALSSLSFLARTKCILQLKFVLWWFPSSLNPCYNSFGSSIYILGKAHVLISHGISDLCFFGFFFTHSGGSITNFLNVGFSVLKSASLSSSTKKCSRASRAKGGSCTLAVIVRNFVGGNFPNQNLTQ